MLKVEGIPYKTFKEKMNITKQFDKTCHIEDLDNIIYVVRKDKENNTDKKVKRKKKGKHRWR